MTNQGPTYSPDYESGKKLTDAETPWICDRCGTTMQTRYFLNGAGLCWHCHGVQVKINLGEMPDTLKSAQPYSGPPRTLDDYDWSKLRAEAAIRIYAGDMAEDIAEAVRLADLLIAKLKEPMRAEEGGTK